MENSASNNRAKVIGTICEPIKFSHETYGESFYIFTVYQIVDDNVLLIMFWTADKININN